MPRESERVLLLIDQDRTALRLNEPGLARLGWTMAHARTPEQARQMLGSPHADPIELVLLGTIPELSPAQMVAALRERCQLLPILVITEPRALCRALEAVGAGADDVLLRPVSTPRLARTIIRLSGPSPCRGGFSPLSEKLVDTIGFDDLAGTTPAFRSMITLAAKASHSRLPILLKGEKGVGKEALARAIHHSGPRAQGPIRILDCRDILPGLAPSSLFGHRANAFPGAFEDQPGNLSLAHGGTLFLDEIEALPPEAQAGLIHFLEAGTMRPLGSDQLLRPDVRLIAATDVDLDALVKRGLFREDLYCRLNLVGIAIPSLDQRRDDLPAIARRMLDSFPVLAGLECTGIDEAALALLQQQPWPGNVRQLQGALLRAALRAEGRQLTAQDFLIPEEGREPLGINDVGETDNITLLPRIPPVGQAGVRLFTSEGHVRQLEAIEADIIRLAIGHYRGRMSEAARRLGIGRSTLYRKLVDLGISNVA